jgi:C-terminal processing protease CtpA/Prc
MRFVEGQTLIYRYAPLTSGSGSGLLPGDVIQQLDGVSAADLIRQMTPYFSASNDAARMREITRYLSQGSCGPVDVLVDRGGQILTLKSSREVVPPSGDPSHDLPGNAFQLLSSDIGYLKISSATAANAANYVRAAAGTKALIIDLRNYPIDNVSYALGPLLVSKPTEYVRYTVSEASNPSAMRWLAPQTFIPQEPHYSGRIVILVDELTRSATEFHAMGFRSVPGALVIGSTTGGADGNVMAVSLPGGLNTNITGLGVFYPDGRPTQRVGIIPDVVVNPTIEGIRQGRDELIEEAVRQIEGPPVTSTISYSLADRASTASTTSGLSTNVSAGYGVIVPDGGATPAALAIFGLTQHDVLVSEASVPAASLIRSGRTYAELNLSVNTGIAIANPTGGPVTVSFYFSDSTGTFGHRTISLAAKQQIAGFLNQPPFIGPSRFNGTFTFTASAPVAVIALRGRTNERGEFLITTLPVVDLFATSSSTSLIFPHFAAGGGWTTQIVLGNPTDHILNGTVQFFDRSGTNAGNAIYAIPARGTQTLQAPGTGVNTVSGSVRVVPGSPGAAPFGVAIFSFNKDGITVSEAGVAPVQSGDTFRIYAETSTDASIQTGVSMANSSTTSATVTLELFNADGSSAGRKGTVSIPANGQTAQFLEEIPGLGSSQHGFQGTARISSSAPISVTGLRGRYNQRSEFLITTLPALDEADPPTTSPRYFPHLAVGGGYTTQFIVLNRQAGQSSFGRVSLFAQAGQPLYVVLH